MKSLILCEKPSVARDFVRAGIDKFDTRKGYYEGSKYIVTYAIGHLYQAFLPEDYDPELKKWDLTKLPFIPKQFKYKVSKGVSEQASIVKKLLKRKDIDTVIIATDAGREGELIARIILKQSGFKGKIKRFWTSKALSPAIIKTELSNIKDAKEFDRVYLAGQARQIADWLIGINATMAYTCLMNNLFSVGRVQTPTLKILAERQLEIENFKPQDYWNIYINIYKDNPEQTIKMIYFKPKITDGGNEEESGTMVTEKGVAENIYNEVKQAKTAKIIDFKKQKKKTAPPLLFNLGDIQTEANKKFSFGADETLQIVQSLYENHHCVSYPRSSSRHLNEEMVDEVKNIMRGLAKHYKITDYSVEKAGKRVFDNSKLSDHHAIIPLKIPTTKLNAKESKIFDLIARRFIAAFMPDFEYLHTSIVALVNNKHHFKASANQVVKLGWKAIYKDNIEDNTFSFELQKGDITHIKNAELQKKQTTPPPYFTEGALIKAMANAAKYVGKDEPVEYKKVLKESDGIGTEATRASIIETLKKRGYIKLEGKKIKVTEKGMFAYNTLKTEKLSQVSFTAYWEKILQQIESGKTDLYQPFLSEVQKYTHELIENLKNNKNLKNPALKKPGVSQPTQTNLTCPLCGAPIFETNRVYRCQNGDFVLFKDSLKRYGYRRVLSAKQVAQLLGGSSIKVRLKSSKTGKPYDAHISLLVGANYSYGHRFHFEFGK